jgi:GAF domain-containing protein
MAELSRSLATPRRTADVFSEVTAAAVELIPAVGTAGILLIGNGDQFEALAGTTSLPSQLDLLQMQFGEGPCRQAALGDTVVRTDDFRSESRWPRFSAAVIEHGVFSSLSFKLYTADRTAGALNLFGFEPHVWNAEEETAGFVLAAHAAAAIAASREGEHLQSALLSRDRIGQAKGIIMERFGVDDVRAFDMLRRLSQESNTRLTNVAERVIDTRKE